MSRGEFGQLPAEIPSHYRLLLPTFDCCCGPIAGRGIRIGEAMALRNTDLPPAQLDPGDGRLVREQAGEPTDSPGHPAQSC